MRDGKTCAADADRTSSALIGHLIDGCWRTLVCSHIGDERKQRVCSQNANFGAKAATCARGEILTIAFPIGPWARADGMSGQIFALRRACQIICGALNCEQGPLCRLILRCVDFPLGPIKLRSALAIVVLWWDFERWTHYLLHHCFLPADSQKGKAIKITCQTFICQYICTSILVILILGLCGCWKHFPLVSFYLILRCFTDQPVNLNFIFHFAFIFK